MQVIGQSKGLILVEGRTDVLALNALLLESGIQPYDDKEDRTTYLIRSSGDDRSLLNDIEFLAKTERRLGIVIDADGDPKARWDAFTTRIGKLKVTPHPNRLPPEGYVGKGKGTGWRLGLWVMPDNISLGYLENFLLDLAPNDSLKGFADSSTREARSKHGAQFIEQHHSKAKLYAWLAWQKQCGQDPGLAFKAKVLNAKHQQAVKFVKWVKKLFID
jgi:hypothetical protein